MSEVLKREFELPTMKIRLRSETVTLLLEARVDGAFKVLGERTHAADDLGIPTRIEPSRSTHEGYDFTMPPATLDWIAETVASLELARDVPFWLQVMRPHGYLAFVPWERLLQPHLDRALLRIPEFLVEPPTVRSRPLDVVLCASLPIAKSPFHLVDVLASLAEAIREGSPAETRIHVFVDDQSYREATDRLRAAHVVVHDPSGAGRFAVTERNLSVVDVTDHMRNPWLLWMRDALQGRSADVVHFLAHGYMSGGNGALALAESPLRNEDERMARFIGARELLAFQTQIGAWASAFTSPVGNYSEMGLRLLANQLGDMRPGPLLHHELRLERPPDPAVVTADFYRFITGSHRAPASPGLLLYCHPTLADVQAHREPERHARIRTTIRRVSDTDREEPAWVAAVGRYIEQQQMEIERLRGEQTQLLSPARQGVIDGMIAAVEDITAVVNELRDGGVR